SGLVTISDVDALHSQIASANWHASASYVAKKLGQGLFIDIGSTTADLILLQDGMPMNIGFSDAERMRENELVYTGIIRTPLMALTQTIIFKGHEYHIAAEHFASTADIYRITGELMEAEDMASTADGAEKSMEASMRRLARMLGHDKEDAEDANWVTLAQAFKAKQLQHLETTVSNLLQRNQLDTKAPFISAGAGGFLVEELAQKFNRHCVKTDKLIDADSAEIRHWASICFPAYSVARLMH
ncbi:MAG: hydantoinase/oxoprolinase family protein, partial [Nitrosomonadales bacterium]|nr:hydantoinase/oxoprolinase family protein [Nitrosomonadales bacterium]